MELNPNELVIHDGNAHEHLNVVVNGEYKSRGGLPRDYLTHPRGCYAGVEAVDVPLIDPSERPARIRDMEAGGSRLSDIRKTGMNGGMIPSRDQNGKGYCWYHSGTSASLVLRAKFNLPYVDLSAYSGACKIKNFQDEGGWGAQGADFISQYGIPSSEFWPQRSMSRANDNPATWANAKLHRIVDMWADLAAAQYDRKLSFDQVISCLLSREPVIVDFNWWSHSVCALDAVDGTAQRLVTRGATGKLATLEEFEAIWGINDPVTQGIAIRIWNSWGDGWSDQGTGLLTGSKAVPDGAVAPRSVTLSQAG